MPDIADEQGIIGRLAQAHKEWRDQRPQPPVGPPEDTAVAFARVAYTAQQPEPQDIEVMRRAQEDPLDAAIWSQLSVVGWRLYAKGGVEMLSTVYWLIERDQHPGFVYAVQRAWRTLGLPGDRRGVWNDATLL
jgi:hypothetical protein